MARIILALLAIALTSFVNATPQRGGLGSLGATNVPHGPAPGGCSKYEVIVARGTGEPGRFGSIVGDKLVSAVTTQVPGSRGYAVQYPANNSFIASSLVGVDDVISRLNKQNKLCPEQKFALVGYSQGAGVMHGAMGSSGAASSGGAAVRPKLDETVIPKIVALVMFGDPGFSASSMQGTTIPAFPPALIQRLRENCAPNDPACDPAGGSFSNHLKYVGNPYQSASAAFIAAAFKGQPLPKAPKVPADLGMKAKEGKGGKSASNAARMLLS